MNSELVGHQSFGEPCCLSLQGEVVSYLTPRCHKLEGHDLYPHRRENLKSLQIILVSNI
jgi:hypothetical protein